jgi:long-chain acyl-CoA synthetase
MWTLSTSEALRVVRDLAHGELQSIAGLRNLLPARLEAGALDLRDPAFALDSLSRVQLATAASTWFNAFESGYSDLFLARSRLIEWADVAIQARRNGAADFTFSTSGSTGTRKQIRHAEAMLLAEAVAWTRVFSPACRVVVLCPVHHIYGFIFGVLLPAQLQIEVIDATHEALPKLLPGDLIIAVPAQWQWLAARKLALAPSVIGVSSTAPLPGETRTQMRGLGLDALYEIYGSSETAGVGFRAESNAPYTLLDGRHCLPDASVAARLPDGTFGQLQIQDELAWVDERHFHVGARNDNAVQVGGHNVSPAWVVGQLKQHKAVREAAVRLDSQTEPARLKAFVVLEAADQADAFENWMRETLPWYACPARLTYGEELPRNAMGKLTDWQS